MNDEQLYKYYYDAFNRDFDDVLNNRVKSRVFYHGNTTSAVDDLVKNSLPQDERTRAAALRAANTVLEERGYKLNPAGKVGYSATHRKWTPVQDRLVGNTQALAMLNLANSQPPHQSRAPIVDPSNIKHDAVSVAQNILAAMQNGQSIDMYLSMIPENADDLYKSAFIYTIASQYPAKSPEVSREMQVLAKRHETNAKKYTISNKDKINYMDAAVVGGFKK